VFVVAAGADGFEIRRPEEIRLGNAECEGAMYVTWLNARFAMSTARTTFFCRSYSRRGKLGSGGHASALCLLCISGVSTFDAATQTGDSAAVIPVEGKSHWQSDSEVSGFGAPVASKREEPYCRGRQLTAIATSVGTGLKVASRVRERCCEEGLVVF